MLKIKDNVDLKELEKFGFKKDYYVDEECYALKFELGTAYKEEIIIWSKDRSLQTINAIRLMNTLYDLIQARIGRKGVDMEEYARTKFGFYKVIGKYERNRGNDLCVKLGDFYTGEFEGEEYESNLKLGNLIDLIEVRRLCE